MKYQLQFIAFYNKPIEKYTSIFDRMLAQYWFDNDIKIEFSVTERVDDDGGEKRTIVNVIVF